MSSPASSDASSDAVGADAIRDPAAAARAARNALTVAHGRLELLDRRLGRGDVDPSALLSALAEARAQIRRAADCVNALERAADPTD
jgi:hypothetical protein